MLAYSELLVLGLDNRVLAWETVLRPRPIIEHAALAESVQRQADNRRGHSAAARR
eukprot:COSAG06_NODE_63743_length_261_cov_0.956790_1_plen_54_part_01